MAELIGPVGQSRMGGVFGQMLSKRGATVRPAGLKHKTAKERLLVDSICFLQNNCCNHGFGCVEHRTEDVGVLPKQQPRKEWHETACKSAVFDRSFRRVQVGGRHKTSAWWSRLAGLSESAPMIQQFCVIAFARLPPASI